MMGYLGWAGARYREKKMHEVPVEPKKSKLPPRRETPKDGRMRALFLFDKSSRDNDAQVQCSKTVLVDDDSGLYYPIIYIYIYICILVIIVQRFDISLLNQTTSSVVPAGYQW